LRGVSFEVQQGAFYTLLGPSGCGKSTTLRCIAGLELPDGGSISIGGDQVNAPANYVPPNERPIGMVFQSYAIWPHMTVFDNVAFPLKQQRSRVPKAERVERVMQALALVKMRDMAHRPSPNLSGGQQQRVALARALVQKPKLLLLDEPLSNLDAKLREDLRAELKDLTKRLGITTLYVTHDQLEALAMSDRVAVMLGGRILQEASPRELYLNPATAFVAQFVGQVNFIDGEVAGLEDGLGVIKTGCGPLHCVLPAGLTTGSKVQIAVRPESLTIAAVGCAQTSNVLRGEVASAVFLGEATDCQVAIGERQLRAKLPATLDVTPGAAISLTFRADACVVFSAQSTPAAPT
jgi:iron(III) transport system ATP-binding protein